MPYQPERHGPLRVVGPGFYERVYALVKHVPRGRVTTYGDLAIALGLRSASRHVGFALAALPGDREDVPWHRVINSQGRLSSRVGGAPSGRQEQALEAEGIEVTSTGRVVDFPARRFDFPTTAEWAGASSHRRGSR